MRVYDQVPSIELQTLLHVQFARAFKLNVTAELEWNGFKVTISYAGVSSLHDQILDESITLHDVFVPEEHRRKGWFTLYCEFLKLLTEDAVFVTNVHGNHMADCLDRRGFYWAIGDTYFYRKPVSVDRTGGTA